MKIQIPKDISEVTPQLCRQVFTEICGGEITTRLVDYKREELWILDGDIVFFFNPFTRIQDTKLCDRWLVENKLRMYTDFEPVTNSWEVMVRPWDWNFTPGIRLELGHATGYTEEMARMVAIIKAFNKLEEK